MLISKIATVHATEISFKEVQLRTCVERLEATGRKAKVYRPGRRFGQIMGLDVESIAVISDVARPDRSHDLTLRLIGPGPKPREILGRFGAEDLLFLNLRPQQYASYVDERVLRGTISYELERIFTPRDRRVQISDLRPGVVLRIDGRFFVLVEKADVRREFWPDISQSLGTFTFATFGRNPIKDTESDFVEPIEVGRSGLWTIGDRTIHQRDVEVLGHAEFSHQVTTDYAEVVTFRGWTHVSAFDETLTYRLDLKMFTPVKDSAE